MPKIRVVLKSGKIEEFAEQAPVNTYDNLNTVRYEDGVCIVKHSRGKVETAFPLVDVKKVEIDQR